MFSGIVSHLGRVKRTERNATGLLLELTHGMGELGLGVSICVSGACLTVREAGPDGCVFDVSRETLQRTTLGELRAGSQVNLERALRVGDELGGHWVGGHVDAIAAVSATSREGDALHVNIEAPGVLRPMLAEKGSVALDGVSLTINRCLPSGFSIKLLPHTLSATTLREFAVGRRLNLEVDMLARYVHHALSFAQDPALAAVNLEATQRFSDTLKRSGIL